MLSLFYPLRKKHHKGFSIIELVVSLGIFALLTGLVVGKYGNFNQSVLLTNLAYDIALTIHTAQSYGLSVRNADPNSSSPSFEAAYGVNFNISRNNQFIFFVDKNDDGKYTVGSNEAIVPSPYILKRGAVITKLCVNTPTCATSEPEINITFKRPEPKAIICTTDFCVDHDGNGVDNTALFEEATIIILGTDGTTRSVSVKKNGQVSVIK